MSRIQISLPEAAIGQLRMIAKTTGEPTSRVAARFVLSTLAGENHAQPPATPVPDATPPRPKPRPRRRPVWLQPWDNDEERIWLQDMWGSIVALLERYPTMLGGLPDRWWHDARLVEWLSALATWRTNIDTASEDPREEIAFHNGLQQLARIIDQTPSGERRFNIKLGMSVDWGKRGF
ncbi:MAG: hypothetical protein WA484_15635 [Solirubrobacteraceae bacterium]